jgi:16S rRNA (cytidine1402-2'-O)-methyltransferase
MNNIQGKLTICPTPIGNLEDITLRTIRILKEVDLVAAEDTRHSIKLLNHFHIQKPLTSYHEHNKETKGVYLIKKLKQGEHIALVSDAGMPGISDPGADLIKQCIQEDIEIEVLPGPTAFVTALVVSGLSTDQFIFEGFLDRDKKKRRRQLEDLSKEERTLIFYESPHRLTNTLEDFLKVLGDRKMVCARELTKLHEEILRTSVRKGVEYFEKNPPKGEFVILLEGISKEEKEKQRHKDWEKLSIREHLTLYLTQKIDKKEAIKKVAKERNLSKREVYKHSIGL